MSWKHNDIIDFEKYQSVIAAAAAGLIDYKLDITGNPLAVTLGVFIAAHMLWDMPQYGLRKGDIEKRMAEDRRIQKQFGRAKSALHQRVRLGAGRLTYQ